MNRHFFALLAALLLGASFGSPARADESADNGGGVIDATTTSKTNAQATSPFPGSSPYRLDADTRYSIQCVGADVYVTTVASSAGTVTSSNGRYITDKGIYDIDIVPGRRYIAVKTVSGTATCVVAPVAR